MTERINLDLKKYWAEFGLPQFGFCLTDEHNFFYIPIAKNASTHVSKNLRAFGWQPSNYSCNNSCNYDHLKPIVVLRDPIERWISGVFQYITLYHSNLTILSEDLLDFICHKIILDDHTEKQVYFCNYIKISDAIFFKQDLTLDNKIEKLLNKKFQFPALPSIAANSLIRRQLKKRLDNKLIQRLNLFYKDDFELINKVKFYE
jgi:hypothetical protein